jgi:hypothetical protein
MLESKQRTTLLRLISCSRTLWRVSLASNSAVIEVSRTRDRIAPRVVYQIDSTKSFCVLKKGK